MNFGDTTKRTRLREEVRAVLPDDEHLFRAGLRQLLAVPPAVVKNVHGVDVRPSFQVVGEAASSEDPVRIVKAVYFNFLLPLRTIPLGGFIIERIASWRFASRRAGVVQGCHPHPPPSGNWSAVTFEGLSLNCRGIVW